jgi:hypothetical protein
MSTAARFWLSLFRSLLAFLIISALWGLVGFGFLSLPVGGAFAIWSLVLGPLVISLTLWLLKRPVFGLRRMNFKKQSELQFEYLSCLLTQPVLDLRIWVRPSEDLGFFWWEEGLVGKGVTHLVVTTGWLRQPSANKIEDFNLLWTKIAAVPAILRRLRSLQMVLWWGPASLLDVVLLILRSLLDALYFTEFPSPSFWMQRLAWTLRGFCFGFEAEGELLPRLNLGEKLVVPRSWNWVSFGVWVLYPARAIHPTWMLFTSSQAFLNSPNQVDG